MKGRFYVKVILGTVSREYSYPNDEADSFTLASALAIADFTRDLHQSGFRIESSVDIRAERSPYKRPDQL